MGAYRTFTRQLFNAKNDRRRTVWHLDGLVLSFDEASAKLIAELTHVVCNIRIGLRPELTECTVLYHIVKPCWPRTSWSMVCHHWYRPTLSVCHTKTMIEPQWFPDLALWPGQSQLPSPLQTFPNEGLWRVSDELLTATRTGCNLSSWLIALM